MKMKLYAIRDVLSNRFFAPQMEYNDMTAIRWFGEIINNGTGPLNYQPKDFSLYEIGEFDTDKGVLVATCPIREVATGIEVYADAE